VTKWGSRIVVPEDEELRSLLTSEFHDSKYAGLFGMSRTRIAVGRTFWWKSLAGHVAKFVSTCVACQRNKARCHKPYGLLQPLPVPEKPWHTVTFDFIVKLPKTSRGNDSICVFVDKLTKLVHFVACKEEVSAKEFAELYVDHVFRLDGLSREFIKDRDSRFTSAFWQEVTVLLGTRTVMSSSFHPQIDGQTERVNQTLETYLRHFVSVGLNDWDTLLSRAVFAHNAAVNETIRAAPFKLTYVPCASMSLPTRLGFRRRRSNPTTQCIIRCVDNAAHWRRQHTHSCYSMSTAPTADIDDILPTHAMHWSISPPPQVDRRSLASQDTG
jgi:hypothetical protein